MLLIIPTFQVLLGFGQPPPLATPALAIADNADGTGGVATITGSTAGTDNEVFGRRLDGQRTTPWVSFGSRSGDGTVAIAAEAGEFLFYVLGMATGVSGTCKTVSNVVHVRLTDPEGIGLLTGPTNALRDLIAEVAAGRDFLRVTTVEQAKVKIFTSYLETADLRPHRPYCVVGWENFQMEKIAGGNRNFLWPAEPRLRVLLCDNDPVPEDPTKGDAIFQRKVEEIMQEITDRAGLDDRLAISSVAMEQQPARNPRAEWDTDGAYVWCSFLVAYD
jgi:hypothetical protein